MKHSKREYLFNLHLAFIIFIPFKSKEHTHYEKCTAPLYSMSLQGRYSLRNWLFCFDAETLFDFKNDQL